MANVKCFEPAYTPLMSSVEVSNFDYLVYDHPVECEEYTAEAVVNTCRYALEGADVE